MLMESSSINLHGYIYIYIYIYIKDNKYRNTKLLKDQRILIHNFIIEYFL
jgi:hypothetical protein